jgi:hypothetical protein
MLACKTLLVAVGTTVTLSEDSFIADELTMERLKLVFMVSATGVQLVLPLTPPYSSSQTDPRIL